MNFRNSETPESFRLLLNLADKTNSKTSMSFIRSQYVLHTENIKKSQKNKKVKISARALNQKFGLPEGFYFVSVIQDYFECI